MVERTVLAGIIIDENAELTLVQLSQACGRSADWLLELVEEGIIEPIGGDRTDWRFRGTSLRRVQIVQRLEQDLGVNLAGAALALELLEELEQFRKKLTV